MQYLLDTHALLWYFEQSENLPSKVNNLIKDDKNKCAVSIISIYEIALKLNIKKLNIKFDIAQILAATQKEAIEILNIKPSYLFYLTTAQFHHKDPFDKLILSTAIVDEYILLSKDRQFANYNIPVLWE